MTAPAAEDLLAQARSMIPTLAARAEGDERNRRTSPDTIAEIKKRGFIRMLQPKRWGGFETTPGEWAEVAIALGEGDLSAGWVYGVYAGHSFHLGFYDDQAQRDVWGDNEDAIICSSYAPGGKAEPAKGGYRFSGRWRFSSGSHYSDWAVLGGFASDAPGEVMSFLIPRKDYQVIDTWNVLGLEGTGSNDIVVEDVFVPHHRVHKFRDGFEGKNPGTNDGPLYKVPPLQVFYRGLTTASIGALQALLAQFASYAPTRMSQFGPASLDPDAQLACGEAAAAIHEMKAVMHHNFERIMACARKGTHPSLQERLMFRYHSGVVAERCVECAKTIFQASGGSALFDSMPSGRIYRNLIAARQHVGVQFRVFGRALGANLFGLSNQDVML